MSGRNLDPPSNPMIRHNVLIAGELAQRVPKRRMAKILRDAGLRVCVGRYSIRVEDCSHFVFVEYARHGEPRIDADADSIEEMQRDGRLVSQALAAAGIKHRFEIYDRHRNLVGYLHHDWPLAAAT